VSGKKGGTAAITADSFDIFDGQGAATGMEEMSLDDAAAAAASDAKPNVRIVVCGHVDSGKSTLNGHLVYQLGKVTDQEMRRVTKSAPDLSGFPHCIIVTLCAGATEAGKKSFAFAYLMDSGDEERRRGVTVDVGRVMFETPNRRVTNSTSNLSNTNFYY
jgi:translation elongation factor EF-1alpha